jgi:hypothetical protein
MTSSSFVRNLACFAMLLLMSTASLAGTGHRSSILRQYPLPGATEVSNVTMIGITANGRFSERQISESFYVLGSKSGRHLGQVHLSLDEKTIIFTPSTKFDLNETVSVAFSSSLEEGQPIRDTFTFNTIRQDLSNTPSANASELAFPTKTVLNSGIELTPPPPDSTPWDQAWTANVNNNPEPGKIYVALSTPTPFNDLLCIMDQNGFLLDSIYEHNCFNFQLQQNGEMTFFSVGDSVFYGLDTNKHIVDTFAAANGVKADGHELILFQDGSYALIGVAYYTEDLSKIFPDSTGTKTVLGSVLQRFDAKKNLVFEWRGIDHYALTDGLPFYAESAVYDFEHANSIDVDSNGNYLLSNRSSSEITQIDGTTGNILWRFGGPHNQFLVIGDTLGGMSCQHDAHWGPNGHLLAFDNGVFHTTQESRAVDYAMDSVNHIATLVWQFHHNPAVFSGSMGSVQRLDNGHYFIGWGFEPTETLTEVTQDSNVVFDLSGPDVISYRALKYPIPTSTGLQNVSTTQAIPGLSFSAIPVENGFDLTVGTTNPSASSITLSDATGRIVYHIFSGTLMGGEQHLSFSTGTLASGAYFCLLHTTEGDVMLPLLVLH